MGKNGVPGREVSEKRLLEMCSDMEIEIGNTYFSIKGWHMKGLWTRELKVCRRSEGI